MMYCTTEDVRCEISLLFEELNKREYLTSTLFIKVLHSVHVHVVILIHVFKIHTGFILYNVHNE